MKKTYMMFIAVSLCFFSLFIGFNNNAPSPTLVENNLRHPILISGDSNNRMTLTERMAHYNVPGVSMAVIDKGKVTWAKGYGNITFDAKSDAVNIHTLFQAGSVSKSLTAFGALMLVRQGKISLDEDVNSYLKSWKIPENEFTQSEKVTLRRLLSHSAGTSVSGFPGYSINSTIPSLVEILNGTKPLVNTDPIQVILAPGTQFQYSGGGTTIVQLLIEDITGERFSDWMQKNVLYPLGMFESTFNQPLSTIQSSCAAYGHLADGKKVEGNWHIYPEMAAAGLWSTPSDLVKFVLYIQSGLRSNATDLLNTKLIREMVAKQIRIDDKNASGLGLFLENDGTDLVFQHNGQDKGFITSLYAFAERDQGVVIMINNDAAWGLMQEITNSIADVYGWPNFMPIERKRVVVDSQLSNVFSGQYYHEDKEVDVIRQNNKLFLDLKNGFDHLIELHPESDYAYFMQECDIRIKFLPSGNMHELIIIDSNNEAVHYKKKI